MNGCYESAYEIAVHDIWDMNRCYAKSAIDVSWEWKSETGSAGGVRRRGKYRDACYERLSLTILRQGHMLYENTANYVGTWMLAARTSGIGGKRRDLACGLDIRNLKSVCV